MKEQTYRPVTVRDFLDFPVKSESFKVNSTGLCGTVGLGPGQA